MRKWLAVAAALLVGLAALVALAALNLDRWLNANREFVAERAREALGREVSFGEIGISFRGGLGVRVTDLHVGDDPAFSDDDFVDTGALDVLVRIWPALFGEIEVARVVLREPKIRVIRTAKGLSTDSLGGAPAEPPAEGDAGGSRPLLVALVDVRNGTILYEDRTAKPTAKIEVRSLDVNASDIRPDAPVRFELGAAILGASGQNLEVSGSVGPVGAAAPAVDLELSIDPLPTEPALALPPVRAALPEGLEVAGPLAVTAKAEGRADSLRFQATLDARAAAVKLGDSFDKPAGVPLRVSLRGTREGDALTVEQADVEVADAELRGSAKLTSVEKTAGSFSLGSERIPLHTFGAGEEGEEIRDLAIDGTLSGPKIAAHVRSPAGTLRGAEYRDLDARLRSAGGGRVDIEKASMQAWGGALSAAGTYDASAAKPRFDVKTRAEKVRIEQLLEGRSPTLAKLVTGELDTDVALRGAGSGWEQIREVLSGTGSLRISDGILRKFNAAGDALRALAALPQFTGSGIGRFVTDHPQVFGTADTAFREIATNIEVREGWVHLPGFLVNASDYVLRGRRDGRVSLGGEFALPLDVVLSEALSQAALAAARPLRYLRAGDGRVELPMLVQGSPPRPGLDAETVSQLALKVGSGLLVDKLLGGGRPEEPAPPEAEGVLEAGEPAADPAPPLKPEEQAIRQGQQLLEGLLGGPKPEQQQPELEPELEPEPE